MLEQAVIDANALREVALKNAEALVIEKYSTQIKDAVAVLLEQPEEDPLADLGGADPMLGGIAPEEVDPAVEDIPLAATDGENLCPCPEAEEEIEIDFDQLSRGVEEFEEFPEETHEEAALGVMGENTEITEEVDLSEELLSSIIEELAVDIKPAKSGWRGTPDAVLNLADEELLAMAQDSQYKEELETVQKAVQALQETNKNLEENNKNLTKINENNKNNFEEAREKYMQLLGVFKNLREDLNESNTSNAKLLYSNRILSNDSLNERQKKQIVEALTKSETVEEAKVIYDTLQSAPGNASKNKQPKSLSEAVNRTTSTILLSRGQEAKQRKDPTVDRWKLLAGLDSAD